MRYKFDEVVGSTETRDRIVVAPPMNGIAFGTILTNAVFYIIPWVRVSSDREATPKLTLD
jgi:hypothetical protein